MIFTPPKSTYNDTNPYLYWIPSKKISQHKIPIMFFKHTTETNTLLLFFHAKNEDIYQASSFAESIGERIKVI